MLLNAFVQSIIKMLIVVVFAGAGIFAGKKIRDGKDAKKSEEK